MSNWVVHILWRLMYWPGQCLGLVHCSLRYFDTGWLAVGWQEGHPPCKKIPFHPLIEIRSLLEKMEEDSRVTIWTAFTWKSGRHHPSLLYSATHCLCGAGRVIGWCCTVCHRVWWQRWRTYSPETQGRLLNYVFAVSHNWVVFLLVS